VTKAFVGCVRVDLQGERWIGVPQSCRRCSRIDAGTDQFGRCEVAERVEVDVGQLARSCDANECR